MKECNTKQIFVGDDRYLNVVGSVIDQVDDGQFNDVLCVPKTSCNLLLVYQITHFGEGNIVMLKPHKVVINDFNDHKHGLDSQIVDDITRLYKFNNVAIVTFSLSFYFS